jgi:hypothetical protein
MQPETHPKGTPMTTPNPENDADLEISEKIEESHCIEQLGYENFIRLCIQFTREAMLHHNTQTPAAADLQHALDFLDDKTTAAALETRLDTAWQDYREHLRQSDPAAHI